MRRENMFCRDFENIAGDLVSGRLMEAGKRERALRHASECSACALWLNAERTLEAGLLALAKGAEEGEAPPHLKLALRAAFDRQFEVAPVPISAPARSRNLARWSLAAAALVLLAVAVALLWRSASPIIKKEDLTNRENPSPSSIPARREQSPQRLIEPDKLEQRSDTNVAKKTPTKRHLRRRAATSDELARNDETVTDYIPLTYLADATAVESGIVLRVELPHSALMAVGLPAPVERTDSRVKADVVIGDDGVARAVRFVRQDSVRR
jgi:hypothetical protein